MRDSFTFLNNFNIKLKCKTGYNSIVFLGHVLIHVLHKKMKIKPKLLDWDNREHYSMQRRKGSICDGYKSCDMENVKPIHPRKLTVKFIT